MWCICRFKGISLVILFEISSTICYNIKTYMHHAPVTGEYLVIYILRYIFNRMWGYEFCLYCWFCRSAYILQQDSLPSSYKSFLKTHGGKDQSILQGLKEVVNHTAFSNLEAIEKYYKSVGVDIKLDPDMKVPCSVSTTPSILERSEYKFVNNCVVSHDCTTLI